MFIVHTEAASLGGEAYRLIEETRYINNHTNHRALIIGPAGSEFEKLAESLSIPFIGFSFRGFDYHPRNFIDAIRLLKSLKPDVVHTHHSADAWIFGVAARLLKIPVVRGRHLSLPFKKSFIKNFVYTHLADAFTVDCSSIQKNMVKIGLAKEEEIFITPSGVDFERFNLQKIDRLSLRKELFLDEKDFLIGTACFLRNWKGVDTLMAAFKLLIDGGLKNLHLVIAGKETERLKEEKLYNNYWDRIHILGHRDDIENVIGGLDIFVLASKSSETTSRVIPEAMALKIPSIGTNIGGIPDVIKDGVTGWLVTPDNPSELAERIRYVYNLPASIKADVIEKAYRMVTTEFTIQKTVEKYFLAYETALRKTKG